MGEITNTVPHLIGGVSRQSPEIRFPFQCEEQINWNPKPISGLERRPPASWLGIPGLVALLSTDYIDVIKVGTHRLLVHVNEAGSVSVYSATGEISSTNVPTEVVVNNTADSMAYLASSNPYKDLGVIVIGDSLVFFNKTKKVLYEDTSEIADHNYGTGVGLNGIAGVIITQGDIDTGYGVRITDYDAAGDEAGHHDVNITSSSTSASISGIANLLEAEINGFSFTGMRDKKAIRSSNNIIILDVNGKHFKAVASGSASVSGLSGINRDIAIDIEDLPRVWYPGFYLKVKVGFSSSPKTVVWMRAKKAEEGSAVEASTSIPSGTYASPNSPVPVTWVEASSPHALGRMDPLTMPIKLSLNVGSGEYEFGSDWSPRNAGDLETNKTPSLVGSYITSMAVFRNRLALITPTSVVISRAGSFFDLFRSSVASILPEDRIDVAVAYKDNVDIRDALVLNENLLLIGDNAQFIIRGGDVLTPETVSCDLTSNYAVNVNMPPVNVGRRICFSSLSGSSLSMRGLVTSMDRDTFGLEEFGAHVNGYIPTSVTYQVGSEAYGMSFFHEPGSPTLYINSWVFDDKQGKLLQNAFHRWDFGFNILKGAVVDGSLILVADVNDGEAEQGLALLDLGPTPVLDGPGYVCHLDRKAKYLSTDPAVGGLSWSYDAEDDQSTFYGSVYHPIDILTANRRAINPVTGEVVPVVSAVWDDGNSRMTIVVSGNNTALVIGYVQPSTYTFSRFIVQRRDQTGSVVPLFGGRLQMRHVNVLYRGVGYLKGIVTLPGRLAEVTATKSSSTVMPTGSLTSETNQLKIHVLGNAETAVVSVVNDSHLPSTLVSAEWMGMWHERSKRI